MYKLSNKIIASVLVFIITMAELSLIGIYGKGVFAEENTIENQNVSTNVANVEFDAYFMDEDNTQKHQVKKLIGEDNKIYASINVKNTGYLKDASIAFKDESNNSANYKLLANVKDTNIQSVDEKAGLVKINQINSGKKQIIELPIEFEYEEEFLRSYLSKQTKAVFTGTYVDGQGKENKVSKEIMLYLTWNVDETQKAKISQTYLGVSTFETGALLQTEIKTSFGDNSLPISNTKIEVKEVEINGVKPVDAKVYAISTKSTNGDEYGLNFDTTNYTYDKEKGIVEINVENPISEDGKIKWAKNAEDIYKVIFVYGNETKQVIEDAKTNGTQVPAEIYAKVYYKMLPVKEASAYTSYSFGTLDVTQTVSNTSYIEKATDSLSKGEIYANYSATTKKEINYEETIAIEVVNATATEKMVVEQLEDKFVSGSDKLATTVSGVNATYNKKISVVNKDSMIKLYGEDVKINIYNGEKLLGTLNKEVTEIDLSNEDVNTIRIETSKPQVEGRLLLKVEKAIKGEIPYTKDQMKNVTAIELGIDKAYTKTITMQEPTTRAEIEINKASLSTVVKNEDVELKAILRTDKITDTLFKNPVIKIKLPKQIEAINIKDAKVMFDEELKLASAPTITTNADGSKTINITLSGEQTKYSLDSVTGGANVIVIADLTVNKLTSNVKENITMTYTNQNEAEATKTASTKISFVAPTGLVTTNTISNYAEGKDTVTIMNSEKKELVLDTEVDARDVTFNMTIINNYNNTLDNATILGRIPSKGNKDLVSGEDLKSTFDMTLKTPITVSNIDSSKVKVYYSTKVDATKDLTNTENAWTETVEDYSKVKSYLIVVNVSLNTADSLDFTYTASLPAKLDFNEQVTHNYIVYFDNNLESGKIKDSQLSGTYTITTGKGPALEATLKSNIPSDKEVLTGNIIKYIVHVKNSGTSEANNVKVSFDIPKCTNYIEYTDIANNKYTVDTEKKTVEKNIGKLAINEERDIEIYVQVGDIKVTDFCTDETHYTESDGVKIHSMDKVHSNSEYKTETAAKATVVADEIKTAVETNTVTTKIKKAIFKINIINDMKDYELIEEEKDFNYSFKVSTKVNNAREENTIFTTIIPEGLKYSGVKTIIRKISSNENGLTCEENEFNCKVEYNEKTRILTVNLGTIENNDILIIKINTVVEKLPENIYRKKLQIKGEMTVEKNIEESNIVEFDIVKEGIKIAQSANIASGNIISAGQKITYTVRLDNIGAKDICVTLNDKISENVIFESMKYASSDYEHNIFTIENNMIDEKINLKIGETIIIKISVIAKDVKVNTKISNQVIATAGKAEAKSNIITYTIEPTKYDESGEGEENNPSATIVKLGGVVWKDENKDGIKDATEELMSGVKVSLINANTNKPFTRDGETVIVETNENGIYTFTDVPSGNYMVVFMYETAKYNATVYKVDGIDSDVNSDALDTKIEIDGQEISAAVTDLIKLDKSNVYNIDLGLVDSPKFDLKLEKSISKITVKDSTGTKVYEYNEANLQKLELVQKYVNETTIVVEYKIKVTNEGAIEGYVKKIADYLPIEMSFSSELNKDWYANENGIIYNASLANTKILPGETKEVTLILTKKMNENTLGTISNTAEIYETYNEQGLKDYDSVEGNKASNEDDISRADLVVSIKTGEYVMFIGLSLAIITIIGTGAYFIKKKVLG